MQFVLVHSFVTLVGHAIYVQSLGFKLQWIRNFDYLRLLAGAIRILVALFAVFVLQSGKSMQLFLCILLWHWVGHTIHVWELSLYSWRLQLRNLFRVQGLRFSGSDGLAIMLYLCVQSVMYAIFVMHYIVTLDRSYHLCVGTFSVRVGEAFNGEMCAGFRVLASANQKFLLPETATRSSPNFNTTVCCICVAVSANHAFFSCILLWHWLCHTIHVRELSLCLLEMPWSEKPRQGFRV